MTYAAHLDPSPRSGIHDYDVSLYRRGSPAGGVQICLRAAMDGMPEMQVKARAFDPDHPQKLRINFEMAGVWGGRVIIVRGDRSVAIPIDLSVGQL